MLQHFTWTQFLCTALLLSLLWYIFLALTFYRQEFFSFFNGQAQVELQQAEPTFEDLVNESVDLIGPSKLSPGMEKQSATSLNFSASNLENDQLGLVPDLLQELKDIFSLLAKEDGNKQDFFQLLEILKEKYGTVASNPNIARINEFIREHAPFALGTTELDSLWD